jgi:enoyl-CoA hydratase
MTTADVRFELRGPLALVTLDRPRALNALSHPMIRALDRQLVQWARDPAVQAVVIRGAGERAFCAGGDVRAVAEDARAAREGRSNGALSRDFFREEYTLNRRIHRYPKPYVALIDGLTLGGGAGLSVHGSHRIATERTEFAMPETAIGFFPDVGATWFLSRCPGQLGVFLALTGTRLRAGDLLAAGLATAFVPQAALATLVDELAGALGSGKARATVDAVLARHARAPEAPALSSVRDAIDRCFAYDTVEQILAALAREGTRWASETIATLHAMSPTSLKLALRLLRRGAGLELEAALAMEYRLSQACVAGHDFYEGIRAVLIDKDRTPRWQPSTLEGVTEATVEAHFAPLGERELVFDE